MQLTINDVAKMFGVPQNTVNQWVRDDNLPAENVNSHYRFNQAEVLEWATLRKIEFSPIAFARATGDSAITHSLADALEAGGVLYDVAGSEKRILFANAIRDLPIPEGFDSESLLNLFLAREKMCSTAVGEGIAIPHPRYPMVLSLPQPIVRLCFLAEPLDFNAIDGQPVHTLFVMICPTVHDHLQLLARLSGILREPVFRAVLNARGTAKKIIDQIRQKEESFSHPAKELV